MLIWVKRNYCILWQVWLTHLLNLLLLHLLLLWKLMLNLHLLVGILWLLMRHNWIKCAIIFCHYSRGMLLMHNSILHLRKRNLLNNKVLTSLSLLMVLLRMLINRSQKFFSFSVNLVLLSRLLLHLLPHRIRLIVGATMSWILDLNLIYNISVDHLERLIN